MLIRCPKCRTTYKVSNELLKGSAPAFRCSRCKHTFELESHSIAEAEPEAAGAGASPAHPDEELRLPFEPEPSEPENGPATEAQTATSGTSTPAADAELAEFGRRDDWSIAEAAEETKPEFIVPRDEPSRATLKKVEISKDFLEKDPFFSKIAVHEPSEDGDNILAISHYLDQRASILPFVSLFFLLVLGFALFSVINYANPRTAEAVIKAIPLIGPAALRNTHLREGIVVQSLRSMYQTIQGNREVFLISGVAINQNPEVVREIQLSAATYNEEGKELERQTIWAGNTLSPKILRGMTAEDIPHLQDLKPLKSFELPPGDSIPFTIVFLKSAKNATTFSYEVVAAEGRD